MRPAILMLSVGPGCCKHPFSTLLQGLRVASNHGHLLSWHHAQAQCPGIRARQRLVLRCAPQTRRGASSSEGPEGSKGTKDRFLFQKKKRSISLNTQHKTEEWGKKERGRRAYGVLNIHELALHSSASWGTGGSEGTLHV